MENSMQVPQNLKIELLYDPTILLLGIYPNEIKTLTQKDICIIMLNATLFIIAKSWKQLKSPWTNNQIKNIWYIYLYTHTMECYSAIKRKEILPFVTKWTDTKGIMLSEISQTGKDKNCMMTIWN